MKGMTKYHLDTMIKGWFVGDFEPVVYTTDVCEVAVKTYKEGCYEEKHYHKIATEITVISSGTVKMGGEIFTAGDIIKIEPGTAVDFTALTDVTTVVVKLPGASDDKYISSEHSLPDGNEQ